jgi:hypothetical protein
MYTISWILLNQQTNFILFNKIDNMPHMLDKSKIYDTENHLQTFIILKI